MKTLKLKFTLTILLSIFGFYLCGQNRISGSVIDASTKEKLAFVNIVINENGTLGTTTDINGNFTISSKDKIDNLTFSFVGYEKKKVEISEGQNEVFVKLKPQNIQLSEIVIDASNNPANRIIDSVLKYRDSNNPKNLDSYSYKIYDNMVFTIDTTRLYPDDVMYNKFNNNDLMAMETVSEQIFMKPNKSQKNILANKVSGINNPKLVYIIENIQSIGFQEDFITINEKQYVNPISNGSKNKYIFVLESTLKTESNDSIFVISFKPYKNTNFNSLNGTLTINSDNWAIQNIKAEPSKQNQMFNIDIQQLYEKVDGHWFPKQLNTNISLNMLDIYTMLGIGKSYITEIEINKELDKSNFSNADFVIGDDAGESDDVIRAYRYEQLSGERLEATYKFVDSIFEAENVNIDKIMESAISTISNEFPIGFVNLKLDDIMDYNIGNGYMLGLGLNTNNKVSNFFSLGAFGNYWFKAKEFNYGGDVSFNILRSRDMKIRFVAEHKFERLGNYGFEEKKTVLSPSNYKNFYINATSLNNSVSAHFSTYLNKYLKGFVNFEVADKTVFERQQKTENGQQTYRLSTLDLKLRIAFGEKFIKTVQGLSPEGNANPVIWVSYQKNLKDVFGSPYNFDKIEFQFRGKKVFKYIGETSISLQSGFINGTAPSTELFNLEGTDNKKFGLFCTESFNTMRPDEFFCDRFAALYFSHNFRNLLFDFKKFHPEIILVTNIACGNCSSDSQVLKFSSSQVLNKGYFESGLVIDNIISNGFAKLGFGAFYRYGPYSYDNVGDNFAFKICAGFSL
ncbi:MAG: carboxypeptidase-like regulatory domain-containing protein [Bacteroidales bacterium]|nr:carboxypeptidase-like regulatory domain-containing protein [Bacteroidales bacterium]